MSLRDEAIAQFRATMEMEEALTALVRQVAQLSPETVMIAWEKDGQIDMVTVPHSRLLAKSYADGLYDIMWGNTETDADLDNDVGDESVD